MSIKKTQEWFEAAVPVPTEQQFGIQVGVHAEEFAEKLESLYDLANDWDGEEDHTGVTGSEH